MSGTTGTETKALLTDKTTKGAPPKKRGCTFSYLGQPAPASSAAKQEVQFEMGRTSYGYKIDALTGAILDAGKKTH